VPAGSEGPLRVAFTSIVNLGWTAGAHYYANLFRALHQLDDARRPRVVVMEPGRSKTAGYETYSHFADETIARPLPPRSVLRRGVDKVRRLARPATDARLEDELRARDIDVLFAAWREFGPGFDVPALGWIPDFQHVHHPELFSAEENRHRDALFARMAANCTRIVLSSNDARSDYERFAPASASKADVLRFVAHVPASVYEGDPSTVCREYHLPDRFVYLPNQFWAHKNHVLVIDALQQLRTARPEITVVCTGNPSDNRAPLHFAQLLAQASRAGVREQFVMLGWVPHEHIYFLMRQSLAVLQPSRFEGWSTTVEEAKSIGKRLLLSNIPVHREQAPAEARYFDPSDASALADLLQEVYDTRTPGPDVALERRARAELPGRMTMYAEEFVDVVTRAMSDHATR